MPEAEQSLTGVLLDVVVQDASVQLHFAHTPKHTQKDRDNKSHIEQSLAITFHILVFNFRNSPYPSWQTHTYKVFTCKFNTEPLSFTRQELTAARCLQKHEKRRRKLERHSKSRSCSQRKCWAAAGGSFITAARHFPTKETKTQRLRFFPWFCQMFSLYSRLILERVQ